MGDETVVLGMLADRKKGSLVFQGVVKYNTIN
jgi:hypothetical protein